MQVSNLVLTPLFSVLLCTLHRSIRHLLRFTHHDTLFVLPLSRYYLKRPAGNDARLSLLPKDVFRGKRVLDVGCSEGWVTCEIGEFSGQMSLFMTRTSQGIGFLSIL